MKKEIKHTDGEWEVFEQNKIPYLHFGNIRITEIQSGDAKISDEENKANAYRIVKAVNMLRNLERLKYVRPEEVNPHLSIEERIETAEMSCRGWNTVQYKIDMHDKLIDKMKKLLALYTDTSRPSVRMVLEVKSLLQEAEQKK